uniref:hypothetical protein n=1 Tax=Acinetobacter baumannii TaxID=470 RepID=UPI0033914910
PLEHGYHCRHQYYSIPWDDILVAVGKRKWRTINHKKFAVKVRLAFLITPFGSVTQSAPSPLTDKCRAIHLLVVSLSDGSRKNWPSLQFSTIVELGGERGPVGMNILAVQILANGGPGDVDLYATYSNVLKWGLFGGGSPSIDL